MSDIDTEITGRPASIEGTASWLRDTFAPAVQNAATAMTDARRLAGESWGTSAGEQFRGVAQRGVDAADGMESSLRTLADDLDDFAHSLRTCKEDMATARTDATAGDLVVEGFMIRDPGPGLPVPAIPTGDVTDADWDTYNADATAQQAQDERIRLFNSLRFEADRVDRAYTTACEKLNGDVSPTEASGWLVTVGEIVGDGIVASSVTRARMDLLTRADDLFAQGTAQLADIEANSGWFDRRYRRVSWLPFFLDTDRINADRLAAQGLLDEAADLRAQAVDPDLPPGRFGGVVRTIGKVLGPLGAGLGLYNDLASGETVTQAVVSQGGSLLAGAAAGAGVGALVGSIVPGPGTAIGAVVGGIVGAGVSIFADGAIDSLFENGPDVGKAFEEGLGAIGDTAEAVGDFAGGVADTVGGWFS